MLSEKDFKINTFHRTCFLESKSQYFEYIEESYNLKEAFGKFKCIDNNILLKIKKLFDENVKEVLIASSFTDSIILSIKIKARSFNNLYKLHDYKLKLFSKIKKTKIKEEILKEIFKDKVYNNIVCFDIPDDKKKSIRFHTFTELKIDKNANKITNKQKQVIASYFLKKYSVPIPTNQIENINRINPFEGCDIFSTTEGFFSIFDVYKKNYALNKEECYNRTFLQSIEFNCLSILLQYYYLHNIRKNINDFNTKSIKVGNKKMKLKNENKIIDKIERKIINFSTRVNSITVTNFTFVKEIYDSFYNTYSIKNYKKEVEIAIKPIQAYIESKKSKALANITRVFTGVTLANASLSIVSTFALVIICFDNNFEKFIGITGSFFIIIIYTLTTIIAINKKMKTIKIKK